jgi:hypothetical protein
MSSVTDEKAVITLEVELISTVSGLEEGVQGAPGGFLGEIPPDMKEVIKEQIDDTISEAVEDALVEEGIDPEVLKNLTQNLKTVDSKGISNITQFAKNPAGFMENTFLSILSRAGPYGAIAVAIIGAILATPELVKALVNAFAVKGGPLNQDYRFSQEEFLSQEFDRITQFKRLTGDDPVITVNTIGFVVGDKDFKGNSLVDANVARSGRVGLRDSSYGYIHGI